jgi:hypothetical protein
VCSSDLQVLHLECDDNKRRITLTAPTSWPENYPQSTHLLKMETAAWQKAPWMFEFVTN